MATQLLSVTTSYASSLLLHSTASCFYSVSFYHMTSSYTRPLLTGASALLLSMYTFLPTLLSSNDVFSIQRTDGACQFSFSTECSFRWGFRISHCLWMVSPVPLPPPRSSRVLQAMLHSKNSVPYCSSFSFFKQDSCPAGSLGMLSL